MYPWGEGFNRDHANNSDRPMTIMNFPGGVSPYGAYDMAGNVAEWVDGAYEAYPRADGDVVPAGVPDAFVCAGAVPLIIFASDST